MSEATDVAHGHSFTALGPNDPKTNEALAALRDLRDATERALAALERDDPEAATASLEEGARASRRLDALFQTWSSGGARAAAGDPELRREAEAIRVLQAVALDASERGRERAARELDEANDRKCGIRGYRPSDSGGDSSLDFEG